MTAFRKWFLLAVIIAVTVAINGTGQNASNLPFAAMQQVQNQEANHKSVIVYDAQKLFPIGLDGATRFDTSISFNKMLERILCIDRSTRQSAPAPTVLAYLAPGTANLTATLYHQPSDAGPPRPFAHNASYTDIQ